MRKEKKQSLTHDPVFKNVGQRLHILRLVNKLTQLELSVKSKVTIRIISRIERGCGNPTLLTLVRISRALGIDVSILFDNMNNVHFREALLKGVQS